MKTRAALALATLGGRATSATVLALAVLLGCDGAVMDVSPEEAAGTETPRTPAETLADPEPDLSLSDVDADAAYAYASRLAPILVRRALLEDELALVETEGGGAIRPLVEAWTSEPGFETAAREMISLKLGASGRTDVIDLDLLGNLAAYLVRERLPVADLLRADYCVDENGATIACDTGAPYAAGVLTTRAFLTGNEGRFNLKRARTMMRTFACLDYPMGDEVQPRLPRESLLPMFQARSPDEQEDVRALAGFGNGFACYDCHGQFGAHAQLFVKFDRDGLFHPDATGQQDPDGELGRSFDGLLTSHMLDPAQAADESSLMFGREVRNLPDAVAILTADPAFLSCSTRTLLGFGFGLADSVATAVPATVVDRIVARAVAQEAEPSFATLAIETFADPSVVDAVVGGEMP